MDAAGRAPWALAATATRPDAIDDSVVGAAIGPHVDTNRARDYVRSGDHLGA